jgi:hypothetical protein
MISNTMSQALLGRVHLTWQDTLQKIADAVTAKQELSAES